MVIGIMHIGSGLGNMLHRYVITRVKALDLCYDFSFARPDNFKGSSFMSLDFGVECPFPTRTEMPAGKVVVESDWKMYQENPFNPDYNFKVDDNTIIDGEFQGEQYYEHRRNQIDEWLKVEPLHLEDDVCVIGFRGGEYIYTNWFLPKSYWDNAIEAMKARGVTKFKVVTDDVLTASRFFPTFDISHEIGSDWRHIRYAKNLIISNSSFYILPAWLNKDAYVTAPKYWAGYNQGKWHLGQNEYKQFNHVYYS